MNIYLLEQDVNNDWDTYDSLVVVSSSEELAKRLVPYNEYHREELGEDYSYRDECWANPKDVKVTLIGKASIQHKEGEQICASYNAG